MVDSPTMRKTFVVPDIKPLDLYDCTKSKICASVGWLLAKSYGSSENVPAELRDPFYSDQYEQEHLKPPVTRLLQSSELYCRTYSILLGGSGAEALPKDNGALLQLLAQRGVVAKDQEATVTDADLRHKPIKMSSHLALMDALMTVGAMETVTAVKTCSAELLGGAARWEDALLYWVDVHPLSSPPITQLNQKLSERTEGALNDSSREVIEPQPVEPSLRYRKDKPQSKVKPIFPSVKEVQDLSSGCAVAAVIYYYCPGLLRLEDVCMKDSMSAADILYNLQVIHEFCDSCLKGCCNLTLADMLYTPQELQLNLLSFLSELLWWFEVKKPEFVQPIDTLDRSTPVTPSGSSTSPSIFKKPFLPISSPASGSLTQSTSMSHIEGVGKTWSKKPLSRPLSAVSFSIPFGLDSDVDIVMGNPVITRSMSSDQLNPASQHMAQVPYTPPEDPGYLLGKPPGPNGPQRASWATQTPSIPRLEEENDFGTSETGELPTIEEALQIIHNEGKMEPRLHPDGAPDGFYLHSPDGPASSKYEGNLAPISCSAPAHSGMMYQPKREFREPARSRNTSGCSRDDDSVLRDGSVDSDALEELPKSQSTPNTPAAHANSAQGHSKEMNDSGVKMTSFAERKKKQNMDSPKTSDPSSPQMTTWAQKSEESPGKSPQLNSEMTELGARLEEKRKAIDAQKKRIEAIFAKHRQRLGKTAFLQLKKEQNEDDDEERDGDSQVTTSSTEDYSHLTLEERLARMEEEEQMEQDKQRPSVEGEGNGNGGIKLNREVSQTKEKADRPGEKTSGTPRDKTVAPEKMVGDYNNAVSKLTAALSSLQSDMQRLTEQQNQLIKKPSASSNKSWVIPASPKTSTPAPPPARMSREPTRGFSSTSSSLPSHKIPNHSTPPKSPHVSRRAQSVPPKSPKHSRQMDIKVPSLSRVLTPPQNVDRIPHLRRVNPWQSQVQTSSSFSIGGSDNLDELRSSGMTPVPTTSLTPLQTPTPPPLPADDAQSDVGSNDGQSIFSMDLEAGPSHSPLKKDGLASEGCSSGAPSECSFDSEAPAGMLNGKRSSLIEISLSSLQREEEEDQVPDAFSDSMSDRTEPESKGGVGFFFKEDRHRPEDEMAQRRAALLERQQKRAEEMKKRKLEQEKEKESNKPQWMIIEGWGNKGEDTTQTSVTPPASHTPPPEGTPQRRGDFTRQEYERRQQLKLMEDLDKVLKQKPTTVRGVKKQRPKTVFRDDSVLSNSPAKGFMGPRLNKVYSHSTMNLSSMANDSGGLSVRKSPSRSHSPSRSRLMSPGRRSVQNGEKDWENASTISSPASIPEYTGPKLYKEPSFKSNKFIIHNAITRCCLAGKVNEPQKNKVVEEMENSPANHFLILFRDTSCQFRAVYTMNPETEEMVRLTGIGPRVIMPEMVESIYKYSSDRKQFTVIPSKTMSMSVDAFTIPGHFWQKRPGTPKKLSTPK